MRRGSDRFVYAILTFCLTTLTVCGGPGVRYGAGNSKRATPEYFRKSTPERIENNASSNNEVKVRVVALTYNVVRQNGILTVDITSGSFTNASRYIRKHFDRLVRKESHSKDAAKVPSKSKLIIGTMSRNDSGLYEVSFSVGVGIVFEDYDDDDDDDDDDYDDDDYVHEDNPVPDHDPDHGSNEKDNDELDKENKGNGNGDQGKLNKDGKSSEEGPQNPLGPDKNSDDGTIPKENVSTDGDDNNTDGSSQQNDDKNTSADASVQTGVRGWCKCSDRSARLVGGNLVKMGVNFNVAEYCYFFCADCYKCRKDLNDVAHLVHDGPIVIWDVSIARQSFIDGTSRTIGMVKGEILDVLLESQKKIMSIPDGEIVVPGVCECDSPVIYRFGEEPNKIEMCNDCGRPRSKFPRSAKNPNSIRGLRKLSNCDCKDGAKVNPLFHTSMWDDGYAELALQCTKCFKILYSSKVYMSEFKRQFPRGTPAPETVLLFMIGTTDIKAAMDEADKKAINQ